MIRLESRRGDEDELDCFLGPGDGLEDGHLEPFEGCSTPECAETAAALSKAAKIAAKKYGSAVVAQSGKVVGIFTTVDVCMAFGELLRGRLTH